MVSGPNLDTEAKYPQVSASMRILWILLAVIIIITISLDTDTYILVLYATTITGTTHHNHGQAFLSHYHSISGRNFIIDTSAGRPRCLQE